MQTFVSQVVGEILRKNTDIENQIIILPSKRAGVFFKDELKRQLQKSTWAPQILTIEDLVEEISGYKVLDNINLIFSFYDIYLDNNRGLQTDSFDQFSKWATMALHDFNEIDRYLIDSKRLFSNLRDAKRIESWTPEEPTKLIANFLRFWDKLEVYYNALRAKLRDSGLAYQGMSFRHASENIIDYLNSLDSNKRFHIVGFNALNKSEEFLINTMLNKNRADIYWDVDNYYFDNKLQEAGTFTREHRKWKYFESNSFNWVQNNFTKEKNIKIIGVPKMVGQAKAAGQILEDIAISENPKDKYRSTALVLAEENLLLPILNSLSDSVDNINITMGFPIRNTPLAGLFDLIFKLHDKVVKLNRLDNVKPYYHQDLIAILKHPIIKTYSSNNNQSSDSIISEINDNNLVFIGFDDIEPIKNNNLLSAILKPWSNNPKIAIDSCINIVSILKDLYATKSKDYVIELEYLFRFSQIFNQLSSLNQKYKHISELKVLSSFFSQILSSETISFKGEPLLGLQLMGMLETRVLDFETVILSSVNEGILPSGNTQNSFIPYDIKVESGLPTYQEKDAIYAYHFYRLIQRAKNVYLLYNTESDDFGSGEKSRFITQIIHEGGDNINIEEFILSGKPSNEHSEKISIKKNQSVIDRLEEIGSKGFSPSALSMYMRNPIDFYYQKVLRLSEQEDVEEVAGYNTLGNVVHEVLEELYKPYIGKFLSVGHIKNMFDKVSILTVQKFKKLYKNGDITHGKNLLISKVAEEFVNNFIRSEIKVLEKGSQLKIIGLEKKMTAEIYVKDLDKTVKIFGFIDRVDQLDGVIRVLDYKTGKAETKDLKVTSFAEITEDEGKPKALQVMAYALMISQDMEKNSIANQEITAGVIALKKIDKNLLMLSDSKGLTLSISNKDLEMYKDAMARLFTEIFDKNIAFEEKEIV
ncbi:MAG: PD-(D/E)XK nuclease family protein [Flavobacteriales bacterium]|nr:PD-(D/E)XK nuclease family protein [Flavobacteriales bacterium]